MRELDGAVPEDLRSEAAAALEEAGDRSLRREAFATSRRLLLRSIELEPSLRRRYLAALAAYRLSDFEAAGVELTAYATTRTTAASGRSKARRCSCSRGWPCTTTRTRTWRASSRTRRSASSTRARTARSTTRTTRWRRSGGGPAISARSRSTRRRARAGRPDRPQGAGEPQRLRPRAPAGRAGSGRGADPLRRGARARRSGGSLEARGDALVRRAQLEVEQGRFADATASAEEAKRHFQEIGSSAQIGWTLAVARRDRARRG